MRDRVRGKSLSLMIAMICVLALSCSCRAHKSSDTASFDATGSKESLVEISSMITPKPTIKQTPTPTPTPTPDSVYIPREELPDGRLFEEGYYAVLPGEGTYYNVYDGYGNQTDTRNMCGYNQTPPLYNEIGLFKETDRIDRSAVQTVVSEGEYGANYLYSIDNGFYQIVSEENGDNVYLYNLEGQHICSLKYPNTQGGYVEILVRCIEEETVVTFQETVPHRKNNIVTYSYAEAVYFVSRSGEINNKCVAANLPSMPRGILSRSYFFVLQGDYPTDLCDIYTFSGKMIMKDVSILTEPLFTLTGPEVLIWMTVTDYYMKDGIIYDATFLPVEQDEVGADGDLIYGLEYDVEGIDCLAEYWMQGKLFSGIYLNAELIAVGTQGNQIAIKTPSKEYVFESNGFTYDNMNHSVLVLRDTNNYIKVISLISGEVLFEAEHSYYVEVADEYIILSDFDDSGHMQSTCVVDNQGNVRYYSENAYVACTLGEYIILRRGPYIGIADLNGDWIMKTLTWELTRDEDYVDPWA